MLIVIDDKIPFIRGAFEPFAEVRYLPGGRIGPAEVREADAVVTRTRTRCDRALLAGSRVRFAATATAGFDHFNLADLDALGIGWSCAPGCNAASVAGYVAGALALLPEHLEGKTLGVIGAGQVGRRVIEVGRALGMRVLVNDPPRAEKEGEKGFVPLDELLAGSDVVTLHVPLSAAGPHPTLGLADEAFFARLSGGATLFNTSRGEVVKESALPAARCRLIFDVWPHEPEIDRALLDRCFLATPHIAGYSLDGKAVGTEMAVRKVAAALGLSALRTWSPAGLPPPPQPVIRLDPRQTPEEQRRHLLLAVYDPREDDRRLRANPDAFEQQRGDYPLRRGPRAFTLTGSSDEIRHAFAPLGYQ